MRVLIMSDMEGVSGIVNWDQVKGGAPMYEEGRRLYTEEINAAVRGAKAVGATEIVAVDCHGSRWLGQAHMCSPSYAMFKLSLQSHNTPILRAARSLPDVHSPRRL